MKQSEIIEEICKERKRQEAKWGVQHHHYLSWFLILAEEKGEVAKELTDVFVVPHGRKPLDKEKLERELIQVAAVVVAWLEDIA